MFIILLFYTWYEESSWSRQNVDVSNELPCQQLVLSFLKKCIVYLLQNDYRDLQLW